jgi:TonB family protein
MKRYLKDLLTPEEKTWVEKHLAESPFDREAMEGMKQNLDVDYDRVVEELNEKVAAAAAQKTVQKPPRRVQRYYWLTAASILLIASVSVVLVLMFRQSATGPAELAMTHQDATSVDTTTASDTSRLTQEGDQPDDSGAPMILDPEAKEDDEEPMLPDQELIENEIAAENTEPQQHGTEITGIVDEDATREDGQSVSIGGISAPEKQESNTMNKATNASYTIQADQAERASQKVKARQGTELTQTIDVQPQFPGGEDSLNVFLKKNLQYPEEAIKKGIQGKVFVTFIIDTDGSLSEIKLVKGIGEGCDEEALRMVKKMPNWRPAFYQGKVVRHRYLLPIMFKIPEEK